MWSGYACVDAPALFEHTPAYLYRLADFIYPAADASPHLDSEMRVPGRLILPENIIKKIGPGFLYPSP
jgi:hypothetical protein